MLVIYTALFGDYDTLRDPVENFENCKFICFTDQTHLTSDIWEFRVVQNVDLPPNEMNRKYKLLPHVYLSDYNQSLYIDSNVVLQGNPSHLLKNFDSDSFFVPRHFARDCIYDEAIECVVLNKGRFSEISRQMKFYKMRGMPRNFGLGENNVLLRDHNNPKVIQLMEEWWLQINTHSKRDQLSLAYVLWKSGGKFAFMDETSRQSAGPFRYELHKSESERSVLVKVVDKAKLVLRRFYFAKVARW